MVSDLKLNLVMMSSQRRPNVHRMGNPAVGASLPANQSWMSFYFSRSHDPSVRQANIFSTPARAIASLRWVAIQRLCPR